MNDRTGNGLSRRSLLKWHKWLGLVLFLPLLVVMITGGILLFPSLFAEPEDKAYTLALNPDNPEHWIRGTHSGLQHSFDAGQSWQEASLMYFPGPLRQIQYSSQEPGKVFALGQDALLVSGDHGRIWELVDLPAPPSFTLSPFLDLSIDAQGSPVLLREDGAILQHSSAGWTWSEPSVVRPSTENFIHRLHTGAWLGSNSPWLMLATSSTTLVLLITGLVLVLVKKQRRNRHHD